MVGEYEEGFATDPAEDELQGTLGNVNLRDLLAICREDKDFAVGNIDVALAIDGYAFPSTRGKRPEVCEGAVAVDLGCVSDIFRLAAYIHALAWLGGDKAVGVEVVTETPA